MKTKLRRRTHTLKAVNFGPIRNGELEFGDLTVLVGAQATGKSIFLQLLKLLVDIRHIKHEFRRAGIDCRGISSEVAASGLRRLDALD